MYVWEKGGSVCHTFQLIIGPPAQLTGLAGELILHILVILAGGADPAAAHLSFPDHLHTHTHIQSHTQRWCLVSTYYNPNHLNKRITTSKAQTNLIKTPSDVTLSDIIGAIKSKCF